MEFNFLDTIRILFPYEFNYTLYYICIISNAYGTNDDWTILILKKILEVLYESLHLCPDHLCGNIICAFLWLAVYTFIA